MSVTPPALPDYCWPVDWGCNAEFANDPGNADAVAIGEALAVQTLRMLTAYRVGSCPVTVRPCSPRCNPPSYLTRPVTGGGSGATWMPYIMDGLWFNACGCSGPNDCSCSAVHSLTLPAPVGRVDEVMLDGDVLPATAYRVDNGNQLVRTDGLPWPTCQDMGAPAGDPNTFTVTYVNGVVPDALAATAAGLLAYEYAQAACGGSCNLPSGVTRMARGGVVMEIEPGAFPGGVTGILLVDSFTRFWNPYLVRAASDVWSPDVPRTRRTTWGA